MRVGLRRGQLTALFVAFGVALALAGCGGSDDDSAGDEGTAGGDSGSAGKTESGGKGGSEGGGKSEGSEAPAGRIVEGERTLRPTRRCKKVGFSQGGQFIRGKQAPNPRVSARVEGKQIVIEYSFLASPSDCRPTGLSVSANSVDKPEAASTPKTGESGLVKARRSGTVELPVPKGGEEPYQVQLSSITRKGIASDTTTIPVQ